MMTRLRKNLICTGVLGALSVALCGCPRGGAMRVHAPSDAKLKAIDTVRLEDLSSSEPVTVEQATAEMRVHLADANAPGPTISLTLEQVRADTLKNNLALRVELVSPTIAQTGLEAERAKFEATFFGSAGQGRTETVNSSTITTSNAYEVSLEKPLPTGGSINVGLPLSDSDTNLSAGVAQAQATVSYVQSLWRGAGTQVNSHSIRIAHLQSQIVDARTKQTAIRLLAQADITYWRLYANQRSLDVAREQYKLAQNQLKNARGAVANGARPRIEIVRAEAGLAGRLEAVIGAETSVLNTERDLRRIMNSPALQANPSAKLALLSEPRPLGLELDEEQLIEQAFANRMDTIRLERQLEIDDLQIALARNRTLPDVTFSGSFAARSQAGGLSESYENLPGHAYGSSFFGLSASIPIGNRAAKAAVLRTRLVRLQDRVLLDELKQGIRQEVLNAMSAMEENWRRILSAEQGVLSAYREYEVEKSQFQLGARLSTDVLLAAGRHANAQLRQIQAFTRYEIAQINLARATGTLLGYGRIEITPMTLSRNEASRYFTAQ